MPDTPSLSDHYRPLCVDLDGTLVRGDTMRMCFFKILKTNPICVILFPFWLLKGLAAMKDRLSSGVELDPASLPYNEEFLAWLRREAAAGRKLVLATATHERIAARIAAHLGIFSLVLATSGKTNLRGRAKAQRLVELFGEKGFDYAGDSSMDLHVWKRCHEAVVVNASARVERRLAKREGPVRMFFGE